MALVKYNNNSLSSVTAVAGLSSGAMNLITTNTISSGVSSSSFTSSIDSTYDTYIFKFINIHPATNSQHFQVNFRDGSSAFDATKTTTAFYAYQDEAGSSTDLTYLTGLDLAQSTAYQSICGTVGNGNDESLAGVLYLFDPSNTTFVKHFIADTVSTSDSYAYRRLHAGYGNTTSAINAVQFSQSTGNIDSGVIKMYGLSKS